MPVATSLSYFSWIKPIWTSTLWVWRIMYYLIKFFSRIEWKCVFNSIYVKLAFISVLNVIDCKLKWNPFDVQTKWTGKWWCLCGFVCVCVWIQHAIVSMLHENECVSECDGHLIYVKPEIVFSENFGQLGG